MKKSKMIIVMFAVMLCMTAFIFPVTAYAGGGEETETPPPESTLETPAPTPEPNPFTPEGQGEVIDHATDADGKEFYIIKTKDDNVFFLVIDTQRSTQNVYFLGMVDEIDLLALARENAIGKTEPTTPQTVEPTPPTTSEPEPTQPAEPEPEPEKSGGMGGMLLVIVLILAAGGGAFYFFKIRKPKQSAKGETDLGEYDFEDDEDEPVIEDDTEPEDE